MTRKIFGTLFAIIIALVLFSTANAFGTPTQKTVARVVRAVVASEMNRAGYNAKEKSVRIFEDGSFVAIVTLRGAAMDSQTANDAGVAMDAALDIAGEAIDVAIIDTSGWIEKRGDNVKVYTAGCFAGELCMLD